MVFKFAPRKGFMFFSLLFSYPPITRSLTIFALGHGTGPVDAGLADFARLERHVAQVGSSQGRASEGADNTSDPHLLADATIQLGIIARLRSQLSSSRAGRFYRIYTANSLAYHLFSMSLEGAAVVAYMEYAPFLSNLLVFFPNSCHAETGSISTASLTAKPNFSMP